MNIRKCLAAIGLVLFSTSLQAQITVPNTLIPGAVIRAAELNTNFSTISDKALNRISGGNIEGNITLNAGVTFDGVDISAFLLTTGEVRAQTAGAVGVPSFSRAGDTTTGLYFPAASEIAASLGGIQVFRLHAGGITAYGVNIIDGNGRIPALTSTYITNLDGSALTNLNASNIASGTLGDARLSANVPLKNAASNVFTGDITAVNGTLSGTLGVTGNTTLGTTSAGAVTMTGFRLSTGPTAGFVLTADASGVGTWQSAGAATGAVVSGAIMMFQSACPATYTRVAAWDNKFVRGGATYDAIGGGADTHNHTVDPAIVSTSAAGAHSHTVDPAPTATDSQGAHTHTTDSQGSHFHNPEVGSGSTGASGGHSHTGTTDSGGGHSHLLTGSAGTAQSGSDITVYSNTSSDGAHNHTFSTSAEPNHTHSVSWPNTAVAGAHTHTALSAGAHTHTVDIASTATSAAADHQHTVDIPSTTTSSGANVPAYIQVVFCKKD